MATMVKKRIQYTVDEGIARSAEYIIARAGLTPASVLTMVYSEIERTGRIPVTLQASDEDMAAAKLINASYNLPSVRVDSSQALEDFLADDGGY